MINAPVLHVNGDYPEGAYTLVVPATSNNVLTDVCRAMETAFAYRNAFRKVNSFFLASYLQTKEGRECRILSSTFSSTDDGKFAFSKEYENELTCVQGSQ